MVDRAGYRGPIEVEVINPELAREPGAELIPRVRERYLAYA